MAFGGRGERRSTRVTSSPAGGPSWWPSRPELSLLDLRDGSCRLSCWDGSQGLRRWSQPALVRLCPKGQPSVWGDEAAAWTERVARGQVVEMFPQGRPADPSLARWFLTRFAKAHLPSRSRCRTLIVEPDPRRWGRRLWHESLEDSSFSVEGFVAPWQHDLLLATVGRKEFALDSYLHIELEADAFSWSFIAQGERLGGDRDPQLSRSRMVYFVAEYARRHLGLEASSQAIGALLRGLSAEGSVLTGRHLASGLPTRRAFDCADFLRTEADLFGAWKWIKTRIAEQAAKLCQVALTSVPGLDLPGWRLLAAGELSGLFAEGSFVARLERER